MQLVWFWIRKLPTSFNKKVSVGRVWVPESCTTSCVASLNLNCKWGEIGCFRSCTEGVYWWSASGRSTRRPTVIIAFCAIRTYLNRVLIRLFQSVRKKSG